MNKLYTLFSSGKSLNELLTQLNEHDDISDVSVYGNAEETVGVIVDPVATATPAGIGQTGAGILFAGTDLEAEGLSKEVADHFARNMENGARVVILKTTDVESTKKMLEAEGGIVSEGG